MYDVKILSMAACKAQKPLLARTKRGFTILEVMMAATVMVLAISSSILVLQQALRALDTARFTTLAGQILQSQMEKLRLLSWDQMTHPTYGPVNFATFPAEVATVPTAEMKRFKAGGFTSRCAQSIVAATGPTSSLATGMLQITLTATWTGVDGREHSLSYISFYGKFGLSDFFYTSH
jgi:Tfp pilus assembly protein PilV